jgi:hypothetical protein
MPVAPIAGRHFVRSSICVAVALTVASAAGFPRSAAAQQSERRTWSFDKDPVGQIAPGFKAAVGTWSVVADGTNRVLAQTAKSDDSAFNIALIDDTSYADLELSVRLKAVAGEVDQGGGVVWRAKDAKNYYISRFNPLEDNFRVYKVEEGKRTQLATAKVEGDNGWHTLKITMRGSQIKCYLDDKLHLEADDKTFPGPGKIGLWTKADAETHFDDLTVVGAPAARVKRDQP